MNSKKYKYIFDEIYWVDLQKIIPINKNYMKNKSDISTYRLQIGSKNYIKYLNFS